jgi:hypothetical protein
MATYYWVGGDGIWDAVATANWAASSGGAGGSGPPNSSDAVIFDSNSGTGKCTTNAGSSCVTITLNSANLILELGANHTMSSALFLTLGTLNLNNNKLTCSAVSSSNSNTRSIEFGDSGKIEVTTNNGNILNMDTATGFTYTGVSAIDATYTGATGTRQVLFGFVGGTSANALNINIVAGSDSLSSGAANRFFRDLNLTGFNGTLNNGPRTLFGDLTIGANVTVASGTGNTTFAATLGSQQITTNGKTLDFPLVVNAPNATVQFEDSLTQGSTRNFTVTNGTVAFKDGVTSTVGLFRTTGANQKTLCSTTAGNQATLTQASGDVNVSNLTIQDINATGGATWLAYVDNANIDAGNNDGWDFGLSPVVGSNENTYSMRSFTQPRRF